MKIARSVPSPVLSRIHDKTCCLKAPGLVRYFEVEGEDSKQSKLSISKCKKCGAEGEHKTYECPIQIVSHVKY